MERLGRKIPIELLLKAIDLERSDCKKVTEALGLAGDCNQAIEIFTRSLRSAAQIMEHGGDFSKAPARTRGAAQLLMERINELKQQSPP